MTRFRLAHGGAPLQPACRAEILPRVEKGRRDPRDESPGPHQPHYLRAARGRRQLDLMAQRETGVDDRRAGRGGQPRRRREVGWGARRRADNNHDGLSSEKRRARSPLAPVLGGEGSGVRGTWCLQQLHALARDANPLTPCPSPPSTRERGKGATLLDKSTSRKWPSYQRFSSAQVGGEGDERSRAKTPHPRPLSPEYRGEGRILAAGCFSARDVDRGNQLLGRDRPGRPFRKRRDVSRQARPRVPCDLGSARRVAASPRVEHGSRCCR